MLYTSLKAGDTGRTNEATVAANMLNPQEKHVNSVDTITCQPQDLETTSIPHSVNQPNIS